MSKTRQLSEDEQKARAKRKGLTRREFNAQHSKFAGKTKVTATSGSFEVAALFDGNPVVQTAPSPNLEAALARFIRLSSNPDAISLRLIENKVRQGLDDKPAGLRQEVLYSLLRGGRQEFANSTVETLWSRPNGNTNYSQKQIKQSPKLLEAFVSGELVIAKQLVSGGSAWWEPRQ